MDRFTIIATRTMRALTFDKVYIGLLLIALISVLVVPKPISDKAKQRFGLLFMPVSYPARRVAGEIHNRIYPQPIDMEKPADSPRTYREIAEENRLLRSDIASLTEQLRRLQVVNAAREAMGPLRDKTRPMRVVGTDTTIRKSLILHGVVEGLTVGAPVLYPGGLVGRLDRIGNGAQAQIITDPAFRITARFARLDLGSNPPVRPVGNFTFLLEGDGEGGLVARNVTLDQVGQSGVANHDWVVIADPDWPEIVQGSRVGEVVRIDQGKAPKFAEIRVRPQQELLRLEEVMVLVQ